MRLRFCSALVLLGTATALFAQEAAVTPPAAAALEESGEFGEVHTRSCMNDRRKNDQKMIIFDFDTK